MTGMMRSEVPTYFKFLGFIFEKALLQALISLQEFSIVSYNIRAIIKVLWDNRPRLLVIRCSAWKNDPLITVCSVQLQEPRFHAGH